MFLPENQLRIFVYGKPVDMRKSFDGLYAIARHCMGHDPTTGHLFVFINKRGNYLKSLYWDRSGFCLWAKRLEQGMFVRHWRDSVDSEIDLTALKCLIDGIEIAQAKRYRRYRKIRGGA